MEGEGPLWGRKRVVHVCVCVCGRGCCREEKDIIGLIGMWKCASVRDLLTHV